MGTLVFYGAGGNLEFYLSIYQRLEPACIIDQDPQKQGRFVGTGETRIPIFSLAQAKARFGALDVLITLDEPLRGEVAVKLSGDREITVIQPGTLIRIRGGLVERATPTSDSLTQRLIAAYQKRTSGQIGGLLWSGIFEKNADLHQLLLEGETETLCQLLSHPHQTDLMYGFEDNCRTLDWLNDDLERLPGEILSHTEGLSRMETLWAGLPRMEPVHDGLPPPPPGGYKTILGLLKVEKIIGRLQALAPGRLCFPNPYPRERGLAIIGEDTTQQIISYRAVQGLHQAFLVWEKLGRRPGRVVEIGAGLGRTAYFCKALFGIDYTIVDIPMTQVASGHFLAQSLGEGAVCLYGEPYREGQIRLISPENFTKEGLITEAELVLNVDSLTEMGWETMQEYWAAIKGCAKAFLSINHEFNPHAVRELIVADPAVKGYTRQLYPLRRPYMEEYVTF